MISKVFSLRNWVAKQLMKTDKSGIMKVPPKGKIDFGEMLLKESLFEKGIDPRMIKSEKQLNNILDTPVVPKSERVKPKKSGDIIEVDFDKGRWNKAGGGRAGLSYLLAEDTNERMPYAEGKTGFSGTADEWRKQNPSRKELLSGSPSKNIGDFIKPIPQYDEKGNLIPIFSKTGKQQIKGAPEGITSDKEVLNLIIGLDIPITEKINILGDIGFSKFRDKIEKGDKELFLEDPASFRNTNIGIGYDDNGLSGSFTYNPDTKYKQFQISKKFNEGGRVPFGLGGFNKARRAFLQAMGAGAAGVGAAKYGLAGLFKAGKPVAKELTQVPIKNVDGMPAWFKPLVNKVIKEGEEVSGDLERVITHKTTLPGSKTDVYVTQDLNTGDVIADIGMGKHGWGDGHLGQPVRLEYKAAEVIETPIIKEGKVAGHGKGIKTKEEFNVEEAEFTGGHPENVKFEESTINKFGEHGSNFDEVEKFATGAIKKKSGKASIKAERAHWTPEGDYASGGRVPLALGKIVKGGNWLIKTLRGTREAIKNSKDYSPDQINLFLKQIDDQIKNIEDGGKIPDEVIQTIRSDPKFKSVWQNQKSADPDLREMEEVLLEYGTKHASGGIARMLGE